jgi:hypothetical protein
MKLDEEYEETTDFSIDGPGGERIEIIKMRYIYPDPGSAAPKIVQEETMVRCEVSSSPLPPHPPPPVEHAPLTASCLKLCTNRGRSCCIFEIKQHKWRAVDTKVAAAPGTVITGLYATEVREIQEHHAHSHFVTDHDWYIQSPEECDDITAMGVITEDIGEAEDA